MISYLSEKRTLTKTKRKLQMKYLNYIAQKIYDVLADSVKNEAYLQDKYEMLMSHKTKNESFFYATNLDNKNKAKFAASIDVTPYELDIALNVLKNI